ncbi:TatD family hydrolase [Methanosphaera sp.]|uniref:TatD family hydrolase n=1 Tax=Methanosphaera sp. TaxID=2666342 RepID=UPI002E76B68A|nr:TatD family hydrolase [Methanosphaera sp.]MEE1117594.1 TatD family hydrolase [Methanosphaera sp.]
MIDSHCHLNFVDFDENRDEIINKCKSEFKYIVDCGASIDGNLRSLKLKEKYDGFIKSTMGYHPVYAGRDNQETTQKTIAQIIENLDNIQAIGEIGLDFSEKRSEDELKRQHDNFHKMLELASEYNMPIVLHVREAEKHALDIIKEYPNIPDVIFHCFSGGKSTALEAVDCGYYISFATNALFSKKHKKNIKAVPLENMLTETDSPYLSPIKGEPNQPSNIKMTIERIERTKHIDFEEIEKQTEKNAIQVYNL